MPNEVACNNCRFWENCGDDSIGECRINPPKMNASLHFRIDDVDLENAVWPWTRAADWCGAFQSKSSEQTAEIINVIRDRLYRLDKYSESFDFHRGVRFAVSMIREDLSSVPKPK